MDNLIVFIILGLVLLIAVGTIIRRRNRASCCSGGVYVAKSRKLGSVAEKKTFAVEGMHCQHCVNRVMEAVQDIPGCSAAVKLKSGLVTVSAESKIDDIEISARIEKAGYKVTGRR